MRTSLSILTLLVLVCTTHATAQVVDVEIHTERKIAASHGQDPTAAGTSIDLTKRVTIPRSLGDVVLEAPGAQVVRSGGMGAFSSIGLRGAAGEETLVLLDQIPLTTSDGGAFDLSLFPAELFERVNTFRGGAPVWLGSGAIGGVLQLVPRRGRGNGMSAALGGGSFGTYQLQGATELTLPAQGVAHHTQLVVRGAQGGYPYVDDRGTRFDATDDVTFRRKNADFTEASGLQDLTVSLGRGNLHVLALGLQRGGGFPGPGSQPTPKIRRETSKAVVGLSYDLSAGGEGHARKLELVASGAYGAERFTDLFGQLGTSKQTATDDRSFRLFLRAAGSLSLTRWLESTLVGSYAVDAYLPFNAYAYPQPDPSLRHSVGSALELAAKGRLGRVRFELRPSLRLDWSRTELHARTGYVQPYDPHKTIVAPTGRVGVVIEPLPGFALSGSIATGVRLPTIFELFGDGGLVLPAFDLKPVSSTTYDGGVTLKGRLGPIRGHGELRGFYQERRDFISMYRTAQFQVQYENVSSVTQWGIESNASGSVGKFFDLSGSFTWLETANALDARLPFRPRYTAYARPQGMLDFNSNFISSAGLAAELAYRSFAFVDNANLAYTDACLKVGVGAALTMFDEHVRFSARMDDSADARCFDLLGFPIPGRSLFFSVAYREVAKDDS